MIRNFLLARRYLSVPTFLSIFQHQNSDFFVTQFKRNAAAKHDQITDQFVWKLQWICEGGAAASFKFPTAVLEQLGNLGYSFIVLEIYINSANQSVISPWAAILVCIMQIQHISRQTITVQNILYPFIVQFCEFELKSILQQPDGKAEYQMAR